MKKQTKETLGIIIAGSSVIVGVAFLSGYYYLLTYFDNFGSHLVPVWDLPSTEIIMLGIVPVSYYLLILLLICKLLKKVHNWLKKHILILTAISLVCLLFIWIPLYTKIIFYHGFSYKSINPLHLPQKTPIVEIVYNTQLINDHNDFHLETNQRTVLKGIMFSEEGDVLLDGIEVNLPEYKRETVIVDEFGNKHFVSEFVLYFESQNAYYLSPTSKEFYSAYIKETSPEVFTYDEDSITPFKLIVLPKEAVESIKYHNNTLNI